MTKGKRAAVGAGAALAIAIGASVVNQKELPQRPPYVKVVNAQGEEKIVHWKDAKKNAQAGDRIYMFKGKYDTGR